MSFDIIEQLNDDHVSRTDLDAAVNILGSCLFKENNSQNLNLVYHETAP
jgi:hypothetical protein